MKAIVFDKDGVLLDIEATWHKAAWVLCQSFAELSQESFDAKFFADLLGVGLTRFDHKHSLFVSGSQTQIYGLIKQQVPALSAPLSDAAICGEIERKMFAVCHPQPLGDVQGAIKSLCDLGYHLGVVTNDCSDFTQHCLRQIEIEDMISVVIAADSGYGAKPDPKGLLAACAQLDATPSETVMVGDSLADLEAANRAGVGFIGVSAEYPEATLGLSVVEKLVPDVTVLPSLL